MISRRCPLLTLTLLCVSLTLTLACQFDRSGFVCNPIQRRFCAGTCVMRLGMGCVCQRSMFGYGPGGYGRGSRRYMEAEKVRKMREKTHPFSDRNMERSYDLIGHMVKLDRIIN